MDATFSDIGDHATLVAVSRTAPIPGTLHAPVLAAVENRELGDDRYRSYLKLRKESEYHDLSYADKRKKDRDFGRFVKSARKNRYGNNGPACIRTGGGHGTRTTGGTNHGRMDRMDDGRPAGRRGMRVCQRGRLVRNDGSGRIADRRGSRRVFLRSVGRRWTWASPRRAAARAAAAAREAGGM
jgi:hypothetical protein